MRRKFAIAGLGFLITLAYTDIKVAVIVCLIVTIIT